MRYGVNLQRDARTTLAVMLHWRTWRYYYAVGVRIRSSRVGLNRVVWRPLRRAPLPRWSDAIAP